MRTVVTAILQQTARQRFGSHSLVSDGPPPVTRLPPCRVRGMADHDGTAVGHIGPIYRCRLRNRQVRIGVAAAPLL